MRVLNGANFCDKCGTALRQTREVETYAEPRRVAAQPARGRVQDPYKEEIKQLRLQIKQLKIYLKQITTKMSSTRARYHETDAFVPRGLLHKGYKILEDVRLLGPQQQKEQLQRQIMQMEQELLGLQQAQAEWQRQML
jgi:hypothetical protein